MTSTTSSENKQVGFDPARIRRLLSQFQLRSLFIEEMGWDQFSESLTVEVNGYDYRLDAVAEKRGMPAFICAAGPDGQLPDQAIRRRIERKVAPSYHQHLIIFSDSEYTSQIWQWAQRVSGSPLKYREEAYRHGQTGLVLIEKLGQISFSLDEEASLTHTDVVGRTSKAFDVDRVTKKFYERFREEHKQFLQGISGISSDDDRAWYASVMLNRLMFVYFVQKKRFLDDDPDYLRNRLQRIRAEYGSGRFHSFYRAFLLRLFHDGLGAPKPHDPKLVSLIGNVPYLNGGIFDLHKLERDYHDIAIPDEAFERVFEFFDAFQWRLDDRPLRADNEINPDVLGYIFEKYINQKEMGAYYTKEDITEYISKSTITPFLFDLAERRCPIAFDGAPSVWDLLRERPDRYFYEAVKKGVDLPLPEDIAAGVNDVPKRGGWNRPAPEEYALPTEIWREVVARRERYQEVRAMLAAGEVRSINDLITYNLDLRQFALDAIQYSEGPELLRAFYQAIERVTVLDPTCGSGAFLFAALNVLEPLYEACLERMEGFLDEASRLDKSGQTARYRDFRDLLERMRQHPNRRYFILKTIVVNNLYGVDIMEEAVEICKLRLFLKLVSQIERVEQIEPLPDVDFNVRAGNTLVGFATRADVSRAVSQGKNRQLGLDWAEDQDQMARIDEQAEKVAARFRAFHDQQTRHGGRVTPQDKAALREGLRALAAELDLYLAAEYGIDQSNIKDAGQFERQLAAWRASHQPFHWFAEFYEIMQRGGFDVIIGNPPYVEYTASTVSYSVQEVETLTCGDLYAFVIEKSYRLASRSGRLGAILPISIFGTDGFESLQRLSLRSLDELWVSCYSNRPSQLFDGAQKRLTILAGRLGRSPKPHIHTTSYLRWTKDERATLFAARVKYVARGDTFQTFPASLEKVGSKLERSAFARLVSQHKHLEESVASGGTAFVYYTRKFNYFLSFLDSVPLVLEANSRISRAPSELKKLGFTSQTAASLGVAGLTSSTFFWYWNVLSDCRNLNRREILAFPLNIADLTHRDSTSLIEFGNQYLQSLKSSPGSSVNVLHAWSSLLSQLPGVRQPLAPPMVPAG